jgi:hypothetical protein
MSPFGRKDDDKQARIAQWQQTANAELSRITALPLADLAAEVFTKGFGPGGPGADDDKISVGQANISAGPTASDITHLLVPDRPGFPSPDDLALMGKMERIVAEALQALEHASLVRTQIHTAMGSFDFAATRKGRAALEQGTVQKLLAAES